jgi:hypothetical protein
MNWRGIAYILAAPLETADWAELSGVGNFSQSRRDLDEFRNK